MGLHTVLGALGSLGRDNEGFRKSWTNDRLEERKMRDRPLTNYTSAFACKAIPGVATSLDTSNGHGWYCWQFRSSVEWSTRQACHQSSGPLVLRQARVLYPST